MAVDHPLLAAYRRTRYQAETPLGTLVVRIGEANALLDRLLIGHHDRHWAYISAWNPGSQALSVEHNQRRQRALEAILTTRHYPFYSGFGQPDPEHDGHWIPEASVLILGISLEQAIKLAQRFGQWGLVHGQHGSIAELAVLHRPLLEDHRYECEHVNPDHAQSKAANAGPVPPISPPWPPR